MEYMAFGYGVYGFWVLFEYGIYLMALHHVALYCIGIWSYVVNLWFRPYRYNIVYWAQRCSFILCWVWRQEFIYIHVHTSLIWHRDTASYLDGYEGRSSCAFICFSVWFWGLDVMKYITIYYEWLCLTLHYGLSDLGYTICGLYGYTWILVWCFCIETNMRSDSFSSKVSYSLAKGIVEILFIFPFLPFISLFLHIIYLIMGFYLHLCYFIFPVVMVTYMLWLVWVIFYCSIRILNYRSEVTHYKLMLCFHNMIT